MIERDTYENITCQMQVSWSVNIFALIVLGISLLIEQRNVLFHFSGTWWKVQALELDFLGKA